MQKGSNLLDAVALWLQQNYIVGWQQPGRKAWVQLSVEANQSGSRISHNGAAQKQDSPKVPLPIEVTTIARILLRNLQFSVAQVGRISE